MQPKSAAKNKKLRGNALVGGASIIVCTSKTPLEFSSTRAYFHPSCWRRVVIPAPLLPTQPLPIFLQSDGSCSTAIHRNDDNASAEQGSQNAASGKTVKFFMSHPRGPQLQLSYSRAAGANQYRGGKKHESNALAQVDMYNMIPTPRSDSHPEMRGSFRVFSVSRETPKLHFSPKRTISLMPSFISPPTHPFGRRSGHFPVRERTDPSASVCDVLD